MKATYLLLLSLVSFTLCKYSGIKVAITSEIFKILTKFDLNSFLQNKTMIDYAEASGQAILNYEVTCKNLTITNIIAPSNVTIEQQMTSDNLPQVKVTLLNIEIAIQIDHLYAKYGLIKENMEHPTGKVVISSAEGQYHFTPEGKLEISEINIEIDSLDIDVRKDFLNWLIGIFKGLIKNEITKNLNNLGETISEKVNAWVDDEFVIDLGNGMGLNLTNIEKPQLTQVLKSQSLTETLMGLFDVVLYQDPKKLKETLTSVLTFGVHGSLYPIDEPELISNIPPAVQMDFNKNYFTNEGQILISAYTLNTLLFVAKHSGYLNKEFTNSSHPIFPWNFDIQGLKELFPQFGEKYGEQNYEVDMKADISVSGHMTPYLEISETNAKLTLNFNLEFLTHPSEEAVKDLSLNITGELPFVIQVKYDLLTINWGTFSVLKLDEIENKLNIPHDTLTEKIGTMWNTYVYKFLKGYTKNVALASLLTLITKMEFKNFKLETKDGFILASIAAKLD